MLNTHPQIGLLHEYGLARLVKNLDALFTHEAASRSFLVPPEHDGLGDDGYSARSEKIRRMGHDPDRIAGLQREAHWESVAHHLFSLAFPGKSLRVLGDKLPNFLDDEFIQVWQRLPTMKCIVIVRNPLDVVNSSLHRRNQTAMGLDTWYVKSVEQACGEWIALNRAFFNFHKDYPERVLLVKYEDSGARPDAFQNCLMEFLGLSVPPDPIMIPLPSGEIGAALNESERAYVRLQFGALIDAWPEMNWGDLRAALGDIAALHEPGDMIDFADPDSSNKYLLHGFADIEPNGRWTLGNEARLQFSMKMGPSDSRLQLVYSPYPRPGAGSVLGRIIVNGVDIGLLHSGEAGARVCAEFDVAHSVMAGRRSVTMDIEIFAPKQLREEPTHDFRQIGLFLHTLCWKT